MKVKVSAESLMLRRVSGAQRWPSEVPGGATFALGPTMKASRNWAEAADARGRAVLRGQRPGTPAPALRQVPVR